MSSNIVLHSKAGMNFSKIPVCPELRTISSKIVGFFCSKLYVAPARDKTAIHIFSVDASVPDVWNRVVEIKTNHFSIEEFALSPNGLFIYCLFVGTVENDEDFQVRIARISTETSDLKVYSLDPSSGDEFEQVYINNVGLHCGDSGLYMYDRTVVMGPIKFWKFDFLDEADLGLKEKSFIITPNHIPPHPPTHECARFPIVLNSDNREVIKIANSDEILIFNGSTEEWISYLPKPDSEIVFSKITTRGIRESYGQNGHRFNAVESKMSIFGQEGSLMAKISENGMHAFYSFEIDKDNCAYRLVNRGQVKRLMEEFTYRLASTSKKIALVGRQNVLFITL